jgi:hypothetical protein
MALGSTQPLTEMNTRDISYAGYLETLGVSTSRTPKGLSWPVQG